MLFWHHADISCSPTAFYLIVIVSIDDPWLNSYYMEGESQYGNCLIVSFLLHLLTNILFVKMSSSDTINILDPQSKTLVDRGKRTKKTLFKIIPIGEIELNSAETKGQF